LRATYVARAEGTAPRPPRTLIEQQKQTTNVNVVVPIKNYNNPVYSLKPVTQVQVQEFRKTSEQLRAFSQKRSQAEIQVAKKQDGGKATAVKLDLQPPKFVLRGENVNPPPAPQVPKPTTTVQPPAKSPTKPPVLKLPKDKTEPPKKEPPKIE